MTTPSDTTDPGPDASDPHAAHTPRTVDDLLVRSRRERADAIAVRRTLPATHRVELDAALAACRAGLATSDRPDRWSARHGRLLDERVAADATDVEVRAVVRDAMRDATETLRATSPASALVSAAVELLCVVGGFSRVLASAVRGSRWIPLVLHTDPAVAPDPQRLEAYLDEGDEIPLGNTLAETEVVRRRSSALVEGATLEKRTFRPILEATGSSGYVCAAIVPGNEAIGLLHADRIGQRRGANDDDRAVVAEFSTLFAWLLDRATSEETLALRTGRIEAELDAARAAIVRTRAPAFDVALEVVDPGGARRNAVAPRRDSLLTPREREILELVAHGATNAGVAQRLTVSEETVKSHMRTILRKLHVTSRSAAVARFLRLEGMQGA
ncbi:helix-turn-helix transcriptional regulator [Patulibacter minatonensis]|uniref:helix-turn-helix transcriptional regulator n=1 Tax=Patulibacter minatonensis TaxID=298163 RepID=UPI00068667B2|nr:helix-turn-helix transcriptional regulator [Patulibacter minatonensis]